MPVTDNQHVKAGDVIAKIDDRDYQAALDQANAQVAAAKASIANVEAQRDVQTAQIAGEQGAGRSGQGGARVRAAAGPRYQDLAKTGAGSVQNAQQYTSQLGQQEAAVKSAEAQREASPSASSKR